jgi:hypothetical protein
MWLDKPDGDGSVGYIDRVVRNNNLWIDRLGAQPAPQIQTPRSSPLGALGPFSVGALGGFAAVAVLLPKIR